MKKIIIRLFLLLSIIFISTGFLFECEEDGQSIVNDAKVYPNIAKVGDRINCGGGQSKGSTFGWELVNAPQGSAAYLEDPGARNTSFIPDLAGIYTLKFTVIGNGFPYDNGRSVKEFEVTVLDVTIKAIAGPDQIVDVGTTITIDGSASIGDQLTYEWRIIPGIPPGAGFNIINPTNSIAHYLVNVVGDYLIQLKVTDVNQVLDYDTVKITAVEPVQNIWSSITDYPGAGNTYLTAVSLGSYGYVGLGTTQDYNDIKNDFWEFNPAGNGTWRKLADFPGDHTWDCTAFALGGKIYVGLGASANPIPSSQKFYVYNPNTNSWADTLDDGSVIAPFPGQPRFGTSSFVLNGEAYVGLGYKNEFPGLTFNDMYKYNAISNSWESLSEFPGGERYTAISFVLNNEAFVGYGVKKLFPQDYYIDFWSFNVGTWNNIIPIQPLTQDDFYYSSIGVATAASGYLIGGSSQFTDNGKQVWVFNPASGWQRKTSAPNEFLNSNDGFVIADKIYCGAANKKWFRYDPSLDNSVLP